MKGKKLGKQSQHVRRVRTRKGVKRKVINPGIRKKKIKKRMAIGPEGINSKNTLTMKMKNIDDARELLNEGLLTGTQYNFIAGNHDVFFEGKGKKNRDVVFMHDPLSKSSFIGQVKKNKDGYLGADGYGASFPEKIIKPKKNDVDFNWLASSRAPKKE